MRVYIFLIASVLLIAGCKDHHGPIIDGIYDHPRDEGSYEVPDNATPIDFYTMPTTRVEKPK